LHVVLYILYLFVIVKKKYCKFLTTKMIEESTFPKSPFIKYFDSKRTFHYEIIKVGTYPLTMQLYYTKKSRHPVPHNYVVKTTYGKEKHVIECSIEYVELKPLFKIRFGTNFANEIQSSESSSDAAYRYYQVNLLINYSLLPIFKTIPNN
jgi:hypothetical protein